FAKHHGSRFKLKKDSKHHINVYRLQAVSGPCDVFPEGTGKCVVRPLQGEMMQALALIRRQARQHHQKETREGLQNTKTTRGFGNTKQRASFRGKDMPAAARLYGSVTANRALPNGLGMAAKLADKGIVGV